MILQALYNPTLKHYKKIFQDIIHKKEIDNIEEIESPLIDYFKRLLETERN